MSGSIPRSSTRRNCRRGPRARTSGPRRYQEINNWEKFLADNGFKVVKLFLNLSKEEQRIRLLKRVDLPEKNWKLSPNDAKERAFWDDYQVAFSEMLTHTSTQWAPWYVIPADRKWFARSCVSAILAHTLMDIDPKYPVVDAAKLKELAEVKALAGGGGTEGGVAGSVRGLAGCELRGRTSGR